MNKTKTSCSVLLIFKDESISNIQQLQENVQKYFDTKIIEVENSHEHICSVENRNRIEKPKELIYEVVNKYETTFNIKVRFLQSMFPDFSIEENMRRDFYKTPVISFIDLFENIENIPSQEKIKKFSGSKKIL